MNNLPPLQALRLANAAGARAVTVPGPMEGTSTRQELDMLLAHKAQDMPRNRLIDLADWQRQGIPSGIPSICTAHPLAIEAAMRCLVPSALPLLVEATCNQINQDGGYTGMTPDAFRQFVQQIATQVNFPADRMILGGDHLWPNPWKHLPADTAMEKARMIRTYALAGFTKLHLDCLIGCAGENPALSDDVVATRAADLAAAAEQARPKDGVPPVYVIGTKVPVPGGALDQIEGADADRSRCRNDDLCHSP